MDKKAIPRPTESELEILQILWQHGSVSVKQVNEKLNEQREVGYTTTLKMMQLMTEKGLLSRDTDNKVHIYTSICSEGDMQSSLLEKFLDTAFRGSASKLVMQLIGSQQTTDEELRQIKQLLDDLSAK